MDQNQEKQLRLLYSIQQETQSGEIIDKIIWNQQMNNQILPLLQDEQKVQVIGLFGTLDTIKEYLEKKECCSLQVDEEIKINQVRGQLCMLFEQQTYYLAFITSEEYLTKDLFLKSEEITVYRFLRDLTQSIILLPSQKVLAGWKVENLQCNQNQSNKISQFEIRQLEDNQLEVKQVGLQIDNKFRLSIQNSLQSQKNTRCEQLLNQQQTIDSLQLFDQILRNQNVNINEISFSQFCQQDQLLIRAILKEFKTKLDEQFIKIFKRLKLTIKNKLFNKYIYKNKLQEDQEVFKKLHKYLANSLRQQMVWTDRKNENQDFIGIVKEYFKSYQYQNDLQYVIKNYLEEFNKILDNQTNFQFFKDAYSSFQKQIQEKIHSILYIGIQLFELKNFTYKDLSQNTQCLIEQPIVEQIYLHDIMKNDQKNYSFHVKYYFKTSKQQNMLIINNYRDNTDYWISYQQSHTQLISKINYIQDQLLYHYEESNTTLYIFNTTLYIFNTKIGISSIFYDETQKKKRVRKQYINQQQIQLFLLSQVLLLLYVNGQQGEAMEMESIKLKTRKITN